MGNELDTLERGIRQSLESYKAPYDHADWLKLEKALDMAAVGTGSVATGVAGNALRNRLLGGSAIVLVALGLWYWLSADNSTDNTQIAGTEVSTNLTDNNTEANSEDYTSAAIAVADEEEEDTESNTAEENEVDNGGRAGNVKSVANKSSLGVTPSTANKVNADGTSKPEGTKSAPISTTAVTSGNDAAKSKSVAETPKANNDIDRSGIEDKTTAEELLPDASFVMDLYEVCEGGHVKFTANNKNAKEFYWRFSDGTKSTKEKNPVKMFDKNGKVKVTLRVTNSDGKTNKFSKEVTVKPSPVPEFEVRNNDLEITFVNQSFSADRYEWKFGDGTSSKQKSPVHEYPSRKTYMAVLTAHSDNGCSVSSSPVEIKVRRNFGQGVDAFEPNGDGFNDSWLPKGLEDLELEFTLKILNQAGKEIFRSSDRYSKWDGIDLNTGGLSPTGTYPWTLHIIGEDGTAEAYSGSLYLKR